MGGSKKVQTFSDVTNEYSPCEKDLKRVLQKNHKILTIAKNNFESINYLWNIIGKRSLWFGMLRKKILSNYHNVIYQPARVARGSTRPSVPLSSRHNYGGASACWGCWGYWSSSTKGNLLKGIENKTVRQCWTVGTIFTFGRSQMFCPDKLWPLAEDVG